MQFAVVITHLPRNYSAYVPDLPGCVATGRTYEDVQHNIREAIALHVGKMAQDGDALPEYPSYGETVEIAIPSREAAYA